jgi:hypothetical protein
MLIKFTQADHEPKDYVFRPKEELSPTAEAIEMLGGEVWDNYDEFEEKFRNGNRRAHRAALWAAIRRDDPTSTLEFADFTYPVGAVAVYWEPIELEQIRRNVMANTETSPEEKARVLGLFGLTEETPLVPSPKDSAPDLPLDETGTENAEPDTGGQ